MDDHRNHSIPEPSVGSNSNHIQSQQDDPTDEEVNQPLRRVTPGLAQVPLGLPLGLPQPRTRVDTCFREMLNPVVFGSELKPPPTWIHHKILYNALKMSPVNAFSHLTTNRAILAATKGSDLHIIDFADMGYGYQWILLLHEFPIEAALRKPSPMSIRISAVVRDDQFSEATWATKNIKDCAKELKIQVEVDLIRESVFNRFSFNSISFKGEAVAVNLSPAMFRVFRSSFSVDRFLQGLRIISPRVVVFVDAVGWAYTNEMDEFKLKLSKGIDFYTTMVESNEAGRKGIIKWEWSDFVIPKIVTFLDLAGLRISPWNQLCSRVGLNIRGFTDLAEFQIRSTVQGCQVQGFEVARKEGMMVLTWKGKVIVNITVSGFDGVYNLALE